VESLGQIGLGGQGGGGGRGPPLNPPQGAFSFPVHMGINVGSSSWAEANRRNFIAAASTVGRSNLPMEIPTIKISKMFMAIWFCQRLDRK
jgi:hypothetical protein